MKKLLILTAVILLTGSTMGCNCFDRVFRRGAPCDECTPACAAALRRVRRRLRCRRLRRLCGWRCGPRRSPGNICLARPHAVIL